MSATIQSVDLGNVIGAKGDTGNTGPQGPAGVAGIVASFGPDASHSWDADDATAAGQIAEVYDPAVYKLVLDLMHNRLFSPTGSAWAVRIRMPDVNGELKLAKYSEVEAQNVGAQIIDGSGAASHVAYRKGAIGGIHLEFASGRIAHTQDTSDNGPLFSVPDGYRPRQSVLLACQVEYTPTGGSLTYDIAFMTVDTEGNVKLWHVPNGAVVSRLLCGGVWVLTDNIN